MLFRFPRLVLSVEDGDLPGMSASSRSESSAFRSLFAQLRVVSPGAFLIAILLGGRARRRTSPETVPDKSSVRLRIPAALPLVGSIPEADCRAAHERGLSAPGENWVFAQDVFRVRRASQQIDGLILFSFALRNPGGGGLHLQLEVFFEVVEFCIRGCIAQFAASVRSPFAPR